MAFSGIVHDELVRQAFDRPGVEAELRSVLRAAGKRLDLCDAGRPPSRVLRPQIIGAADWDRAARAAGAVDRVIRRLVRLAGTSAELQARIGLTEEAARRTRQADEDPHIQILGRADGVFDVSGDYRILEHNIGSCGGGYFADGLGDLMDATSLLAGESGPWRRHPFHEALAADLATPRSGTPTIGFVDAVAADLELQIQLGREEALMAYALHENHGFDVVVGEPRDLATDRTVSLKGIDLDVLITTPEVLRDVSTRVRETRASWAPWGEVRGFRFLNAVSPRYAGHSKALLAVPWASEELLVGIDRDDVEAFRRAVPWTAVVSDGPVSWRGRRHDLLELLAREREQFVLKPAVGRGGRDVVLGWSTSQEAWEASLRDRGELLVAQERVEAQPQRWPVVDDADATAWVETPASVDVFVWSHHPPASGIARLMVDGRMNISSGSSVMPVYVAP